MRNYIRSCVHNARIYLKALILPLVEVFAKKFQYCRCSSIDNYWIVLEELYLLYSFIEEDTRSINKLNNRETYFWEIFYKEGIILVTICNLRLNCKVLWSKRMFLHRKCCCIVNKGFSTCIKNNISNRLIASSAHRAIKKLLPIMYYSIFRKERKVKVRLNVEVVRIEAKTKSLRNGFNHSKGSYTYSKYTFDMSII